MTIFRQLKYDCQNKILKSLFVLCDNEQIREAIGVILSVLCSNIRLRMSYQQEHPSEEGRTDVDSQLKEENWFKLIGAKASEAVKNIQQASISDSLDTSADVDMENAQSNGDSLDDVKWMETVLANSIFGVFFFLPYI